MHSKRNATFKTKPDASLNIINVVKVEEEPKKGNRTIRETAERKISCSDNKLKQSDVIDGHKQF